MGGLAAAAGFGQMLGSAAGGWLFGAVAQRSFGWLAVPLGVLLVFLLVRPGWWSVTPTESTRHRPAHSKPRSQASARQTKT